jgi:hypothetical protein
MQKTLNHYKKYIFVSIYIFCSALLSIRAFKHQEYNWDMIPYMAVILSYENSDINSVHDSVYNTIKEQAPANDHKLLVDGGIEMRKHSAQNATYFKEQLPFYTVKPLYTKFAYWLYKAGVPLTKAPLLPSVISYFFIGVLIFFWLKKYLHQFLLFPVCLLIMLCRPMLATASVSTSDCLSALILLFAFYFLIEKKIFAGVCIFLILSIFARLDNIIPALFIILLLTTTNKWKERISFKTFLFLAIIMWGSYFFISHNVQEYGWSIFYYPSFISHLNPAYDSHLPFSLSNYFSVAHSQIMSGLTFSDLILFLLLGLILFIDQDFTKSKTPSFDQLLFIVIVLTIFARFILQPVIADRLYIAYYIGIVVLLIKKIGLKFERDIV